MIRGDMPGQMIPAIKLHFAMAAGVGPEILVLVDVHFQQISVDEGRSTFGTLVRLLSRMDPHMFLDQTETKISKFSKKNLE